MDETPPSIPVESPGPQPTTLTARLFNVFATPGEVFEEIKVSPPCTANWVVPALIAVAVSWLAAVVVFSQDSIKHQVSEISAQAIEKQIEAMKPSEAQADQMRAAAEKFGGIGQKIGAYVSPVVVAFAVPFIWGGLFWLVGTIVFKQGVSYMKSVEVVGLSGMIGVLEIVVRSLLMVSMGSLFAGPSLALLVKDFDPQNMLHGLLAVANVMTLWWLVVYAIGLARLVRTALWKAAVWVFGIWALYTGVLLGLAFAVQAVFKAKTG